MKMIYSYDVSIKKALALAKTNNYIIVLVARDGETAIIF